MGLAPAACTELPPEGAKSPGSIALRLTLAQGAALTSVDYSITGNGITPITGTVSVAQSTVLAFQVGGIPAGTGYLLELTGTASDGSSCVGSNTFDVMADQVSSVVVEIACTQEPSSGNVQVGVEVNRCAAVTGLTALPRTLE